MHVLGQLWAFVSFLKRRRKKKKNEKPKEWDGCTLKREIKEEIIVIIYNNNNDMLESCQCPHSPLYFLNTDILGNGSVLFHLNFTQLRLLHVN